MATSAEDVANGALEYLGADPIEDLDNSGIAGVTRQTYETRVRGLMGMLNWRQFRAWAALSQDAQGVPPVRWQYAFLMPKPGSDRIGFPSDVYASADPYARPTTAFEYAGKYIVTNHDVIVISYTQRKPEREWLENFKLLAMQALAFDWAMPVTEIESRADFFRTAAFGLPSEGSTGGQFKVAAMEDVRNEPAGSMLDAHDPIGDIRFAGR